MVFASEVEGGDVGDGIPEMGEPVDTAVPKTDVGSLELDGEVEGDDAVAAASASMDPAVDVGNWNLPIEEVVNLGAVALVQQLVLSPRGRQQ
jgi:hypothetical protein